MDENIKENIIKVVGVLIILILLMFTISTNVKYGKLENKVDGYKYEISILTDKNTEYEKLIESYKESQKEDKATIETQQETITNLETQVKNLNGKINKLDVEIVTLTKERDNANKKVTTLNNEITKLNKNLDDNKLVINDLSTKFTEANNNVIKLTTEKNILNNDYTKLQEKLTSVNKYYVVNSEIELLEALKKDGNIILNNDIIMSTNVVVKDKIISLNLNGHNLVATSIELDDTNLEIKNTGTTGKLSIVGDNDDLVKGIKVNPTSTLRITNGDYEGKNLIQVQYQGTLYVLGGTITTKDDERINQGENSNIVFFEDLLS